MLIDVLIAFLKVLFRLATSLFQQLLLNVNMKWNGRNAGAVSARFNKKGAKLSDLFLLL